MSEVRQSVNIQHSELSDRGLNERRPLNEDSFLADGTRHVFAVADGVGGRPEGDVASQRTLSAMLRYLGKAASCFQGLDTNAEEVLLEKLEDREIRLWYARAARAHGRGNGVSGLRPQAGSERRAAPAVEDAGFCPVTRRPSMMAKLCQFGAFSNSPPSRRSSSSTRPISCSSSAIRRRWAMSKR